MVLSKAEILHLAQNYFPLKYILHLVNSLKKKYVLPLSKESIKKVCSPLSKQKIKIDVVSACFTMHPGTALIC